LDDLPIIAEDLGFLTEDVHKLLRDSGFPGMKVLEFAFDPREESNYLPYTYNSNSVSMSARTIIIQCLVGLMSLTKIHLNFSKSNYCSSVGSSIFVLVNVHLKPT